MLDKFKLIEAGAGALLALVAVSSYIGSRTTAAKANAEHQANLSLQVQLQQMKADFDKQIAARDVQYRAESKNLNDRFDVANKNNQQLAALLSQVMKLPVPVTVTTPPATKDNPSPIPVVSVPQVDFKAVSDYSRECEQCKLVASKTQADLLDRVKQQQLAEQQITSLKSENQALLKVANGTFWSNAKRATKWLFIGAGVGAVAVCGSGHCK